MITIQLRIATTKGGDKGWRAVALWQQNGSNNMFDLVQVDSEWRTSSLELLELINQIRVAEGLNKMMPSRFNRKVRDELEGDNLRWQKSQR